MDDTVQVQCPYCWQLQEIYLEPDLGGQLVQDCEVCCRPWSIHVSRDADGEPSITVERAQ